MMPHRMITHLIRPTIVFMILSTLLFGAVYPGIITLILQNAYPKKSNGSLIQRYDGIRGSRLIGQSFTQPHYFWGRLSATDPQYNPAASAGSNLSPANPHLLENAKNRIDALRKIDPHNEAPIPIDLVTSSASGLDPHISLAAAHYQLPRVARARQLKEEQVSEILYAVQENRQFGILGEPRVNVLKLNIALDDLEAKKIRPVPP